MVNWFGLLLKNIIILIIFPLTFQCMTLPPSVSLGEPIIQKKELGIAVLDKVKVLNVVEDYRKDTEDGLTINLRSHLKQGKYFENVYLFNEEIPKNTEFERLQFEFTSYSHKRRIYEGYFPFAFLTLTLYIWFGGTIGIDSMEYDCRLIVRDMKDQVVYEVQKKETSEKSVNFYSTEYMLPKSEELRTKLISDIMEHYKKRRVK
ncbi:transposase [Leptospira meyeri]|uniref:transposase n=1 Tax=Leptospira meyeri TaxID=29508 RepID=UPI000C2AE4E0|nr:transposase [Leptospira meyeri]PJZ79298.1 transposase [Leptospira meyeri]PJZ95155.1 transposase [Leptospira meyeri]